MKVTPPTPSAAAPRPVASGRPASASASTSVLDKVLAIVAMIVSLAAVGSLVMLYQIFVENPGQ